MGTNIGTYATRVNNRKKQREANFDGFKGAAVLKELLIEERAYVGDLVERVEARQIALRCASVRKLCLNRELK